MVITDDNKTLENEEEDDEEMEVSFDVLLSVPHFRLVQYPDLLLLQCFECTSVAVQVDDSDTSDDDDEDDNKAEDDEEEEDDDEAMEDEDEEELEEGVVDQNFRLELMKVLHQQNALVGLKSQIKPKSDLDF